MAAQVAYAMFGFHSITVIRVKGSWLISDPGSEISGSLSSSAPDAASRSSPSTIPSSPIIVVVFPLLVLAACLAWRCASFGSFFAKLFCSAGKPFSIRAAPRRVLCLCLVCSEFFAFVVGLLISEDGLNSWSKNFCFVGFSFRLVKSFFNILQPQTEPSLSPNRAMGCNGLDEIQLTRLGSSTRRLVNGKYR